MKIHQLKLLVPMFSLSLLAVTGCSKVGSSAPTPLAADKIPTTINQAFTQSSDDTKELVASYVSAYQQQDIPTAFTGLQKLCKRTDLTPAQRAVASRAMMTTMQQLRTASDNGNQPAQALLHQYLSTR